MFNVKYSHDSDKLDLLIDKLVSFFPSFFSDGQESVGQNIFFPVVETVQQVNTY